MREPISYADKLCRELLALDREEDAMRRILASHDRFLDAIDWTSMTRSDRRRAEHHGETLRLHLDRVSHAIDQRIFELIHRKEDDPDASGRLH
ncbi:hypothetical protein [Sphingobium chungbukense]|uniref:hypothetical protein n=1 Tax=Sphingobium chungbukense TaxID=56193 RepID=UPI000AAB1216|nr:hypothetical protein [Sphingobium chungbukense]